MTEYEQPDAWVPGLRCSRDHNWAERGGRLWSGSDSDPVELYAAPSEDVVRSLVAGWLAGNPQLDTNLHSSVRRVLAESPRATDPS